MVPGRQIQERGFVVEGVVVLDGLEGEGAVHGSGFEIEKAEAAGEMGGEGAFAGAGGAVDGDNTPSRLHRVTSEFASALIRASSCPACGRKTEPLWSRLVRPVAACDRALAGVGAPVTFAGATCRAPQLWTRRLRAPLP